ncbi:MAG: hypothetical protein L0Z62_42815 [Gemmataceae bacterium]|nr:hypothetical protein [Gemmataceae bacterium]
MNPFTPEKIEELATTTAAQPFRPFAVYDAQRDCLEFFASNDSFYARSLDDLVTAYYSHETNTPVGLRVKKVKQFFKNVLKQAPGFKAEIHNHRIRVEHLFTAKIWSSDDPQGATVLTYRKLRDVAQKNEVEAEIDDLAELVA